MFSDSGKQQPKALFLHGFLLANFNPFLDIPLRLGLAWLHHKRFGYLDEAVMNQGEALQVVAVQFKVLFRDAMPCYSAASRGI